MALSLEKRSEYFSPARLKLWWDIWSSLAKEFLSTTFRGQLVDGEPYPIHQNHHKVNFLLRKSKQQNKGVWT